MAARYLGGMLVLLGLAFNPSSVGYYTPEGDLHGVAARVVIYLVEAVCVVSGAYVFLRKPRGCGNYLLCLSALLAAVALVELLSCATDVFVPRDYAERHNLFYGFYRPDSVLGFRPRANLKDFRLSWMEEGVTGTYSTDDHGFANDNSDYSQGKIFFVGDSFTFGYWVRREDSFVGRVESALNTSAVNLGVGGYGFEQYAALLKTYVPQYRPGGIVLCIFANDLQRILSREYLNDYYRRAGWDKYQSLSYKNRSAVAKVVAWWADVRHSDRYEMPNGMVLHRHRGASREYIDSRLYLDVERKLLEIVEVAAQNQVKLSIFCVPSKESVYRDEYARRYGTEYLRNEEEGFARICGIAAAHNVRCVDLTNVFRGRAEKGVKLYFDKDPHWNGEGHLLAANVMLKDLAE